MGGSKPEVAKDEEHLENGRTNLSDATHVALIRESSEDFETISLASVKEVKTTPISLAARHP